VNAGIYKYRMPTDLYTCSVRVFDRALAGLSTLLHKGMAHAAAHSIAEAELLDARLSPDMYPLLRQAQIVCDFARQTPSRVLDLEVPAALEGSMSHSELQTQIASARAFLAGLARDQFEGRDARPVTFPISGDPSTQPASRFVLGFATPNLYFHLVTAYAILRSRGVPLGKVDYFGVGS
jgi:hypothetical protein